MSVTIDGTNGVKVNGTQLQLGPAFSAVAATSQSVTAGTITKVTLGTVEFDTNNNFASSRFTPTVPGYYQINGQVYGSGTAISTVICYLYKNGSVIQAGSFGAANGSANGLSSVNTVVYLNGTTDYIELFGYVQGGTGTQLTVTAGGYQCRFSGVFVRGT